jgi:hypothetical protein
MWRYSYADQGWTEFNLPEAFLVDYNFAYPRQLVVDKSGDANVIMELCGEPAAAALPGFTGSTMGSVA